MEQGCDGGVQDTVGEDNMRVHFCTLMMRARKSALADL